MWNGTSGAVVGDVGGYDGGYDPVRLLRKYDRSDSCSVTVPDTSMSGT